ncbi:MAG: rhomboid family intramembrane serine protease [Chloroflexi bacterium]|nr:rhomboid family intramembrane serine protease [Chloroflexota bacterium]
MLPLNDIEPNRYTSLPLMTLGIICLNVIVMVAEDIMIQYDVSQFIEFINLYGAVPSLMISRQGGGGLSSVTSMFLHSGFWHLSGNMLALWVYGRRVEDACGPWRFLIFYLTAGIIANVFSALTRIDSTIPGIGASGAIAGVMGAYLILYPKGRIRTLVLLFVVPFTPKIRAYWLILYFLIFQIPPALNALIYQTEYHVGYWAHLGGFFASVLILFFLRPDAFHRYRNELPL